MVKESKHHIEQQDIIFRETFNYEQSVRRNGGNPSAGATDVTFEHGVGIFDGVTAYIEYPVSKLRLAEPERPFSIRTKVYLTDTDASVFLQFYISGANLSHTLRFMIGGAFPAVGMTDKLILELWDSSNDSATEEVRGRMYDQVLTSLALNKWTEFVCTYDGRAGATPEAGICLYMDGVQVDDADTSYSPGLGAFSQMRYHSDATLKIGQNLEGKMEFIEVWNRVLSSSEILNMI